MNLGYSVKDVLSIYLKDPGRGIDDYMSAGDMNFRTLVARARKALPGFGSDDVRRVKMYLNPGATRNPCDVTG